jgi:hypothetical protein
MEFPAPAPPWSHDALALAPDPLAPGGPMNRRLRRRHLVMVTTLAVMASAVLLLAVLA